MFGHVLEYFVRVVMSQSVQSMSETAPCQTDRDLYYQRYSAAGHVMIHSGYVRIYKHIM